LSLHLNAWYGTMLGWAEPSRSGSFPVAEVVAGLIGEPGNDSSRAGIGRCNLLFQLPISSRARRVLRWKRSVLLPGGVGSGGGVLGGGSGGGFLGLVWGGSALLERFI